MITSTHERCAVCEWLGREAERTAQREGVDTWLSLDQRDGTSHSALYERDPKPGQVQR